MGLRLRKLCILDFDLEKKQSFKRTKSLSQASETTNQVPNLEMGKVPRPIRGTVSRQDVEGTFLALERLGFNGSRVPKEF